MKRSTRQPEPEQDKGAPDWMVTFSDCMTLLLTFFVLLLSFSSFDDKVFRKARVFFTGAMHSVSPAIETDKHSFVIQEQIKQIVELSKGSEKHTPDRNPDDALNAEDLDMKDFHRKRVFLITSDKIFWGNGAVISRQGGTILSQMARFLIALPEADRVVISENAAGDSRDDYHTGLERTWAVIQYLSSIDGLEKNKLNIAAKSIESRRNARANSADYPDQNAGRVLEIVLLQRSIYN